MEGHYALRGRAMPEVTIRSDKAWQQRCADRGRRQFVLCIPIVRSFLLRCAQEPAVSFALQSCAPI